jgi:hypothetical protein
MGTQPLFQAVIHIADTKNQCNQYPDTFRLINSIKFNPRQVIRIQVLSETVSYTQVWSPYEHSS